LALTLLLKGSFVFLYNWKHAHGWEICCTTGVEIASNEMARSVEGTPLSIYLPLLDVHLVVRLCDW
jgi:hypothetical protein